ncbi:hypothetical protein FHT40_004294 [Mycolicibacterium sp. BK556]|uniref:DUF1214 domain-containing protein n=1 Tax=unclassified Mycolicibacterium TaxID=2636767 RepID=UPI00161DB93D|nr:MULTISPECIES: DUF1214 domain-containing protein [unclassified Mycolicibacterium]MBB3604616.1 hypothetical protein [Mycolicibacterium sp. BK556]MBB3634671.1 hypothetical protein [Mycolicibacterium sp. BK607]
MASTEAVTADNFTRAESDLYFSHIAEDDGFGQFMHYRELSPIDHQRVIRQNRDTLYSAAVFDLEAGPVTVTLPDAGPRFLSAQIITEDHYVPRVIYGEGQVRLTREEIGTRYAVVAVRILVDPNDPDDLPVVHRLQDAIGVQQGSRGQFEIPSWDPVSQNTVRQALLTLATTLTDTKRTFGTRQSTDPVRHLIGSASAWGGNPESDAFYLTITPKDNDGNTIHRLTVKDVPVDGFWSVTVYNKDGYFTANPLNRYSFNSLTATADADGATTIQFGGCRDDTANCLPITPGWNYLVRLYRPRPAILNGDWTFPTAQTV